MACRLPAGPAGRGVSLFPDAVARLMSRDQPATF